MNVSPKIRVTIHFFPGIPVNFHGKKHINFKYTVSTGSIHECHNKTRIYQNLFHVYITQCTKNIMYFIVFHFYIYILSFDRIQCQRCLFVQSKKFLQFSNSVWEPNIRLNIDQTQKHGGHSTRAEFVRKSHILFNSNEFRNSFIYFSKTLIDTNVVIVYCVYFSNFLWVEIICYCSSSTKSVNMFCN